MRSAGGDVRLATVWGGFCSDVASASGVKPKMSYLDSKRRWGSLLVPAWGLSPSAVGTYQVPDRGSCSSPSPPHLPWFASLGARCTVPHSNGGRRGVVRTV